MYLWLAVTPDEYELIIAVETSAAKLAHRLGTLDLCQYSRHIFLVF